MPPETGGMTTGCRPQSTSRLTMIAENAADRRAAICALLGRRNVNRPALSRRLGSIASQRQRILRLVEAMC